MRALNLGLLSSAGLLVCYGKKIMVVLLGLWHSKDLVDLMFCHSGFQTSIQVNKYKRHLSAIIVSNGQE